jgi:hypothetical protein
VQLKNDGKAGEKRRDDNLLAEARKDREALVAELESAAVGGVRWDSNGRDCHCPFHDDRNPSAGIFQGQDGSWRFKCFPCGLKAADLFDVRARRLNRPLPDVLREWRQAAAPDRRTADPERRPTRVYPSREALQAAVAFQGQGEPPLELRAAYEYADPDTRAVDLVVFRLWDAARGRKTFRQATQCPGGWCLRGPEGRWPVYNRSRLRGATDVVVVEGENKVHALTEIFRHLPAGWVATCNPGGGEKGKAFLCDWSPLAGKRVYHWPDNDPPDAKTEQRTGHNHMRDVATVAQRLSPKCEVYWFDPAPLDLPPKGDAVDWVGRLRGEGLSDREIAERFEFEVVARCRRLRASEPLLRCYQDIRDGKLFSVPFPWPFLSSATQALQPGHIMMVCGEPGAGKSFFLVECLWKWLHGGHPPACLMLELSARFHSRRLHAMLAEENRLLENGWVKEHWAEVERLYGEHAERLDEFWAVLDTVPAEEPITADGCCDWLEGRLKQGARVAVIDPITALADDKPWLTDRLFLRRSRGLCERYGASLLITTHPDRGGRKMARSQAVDQLVDTVVWLQRHPEPKLDRVRKARHAEDSHGVKHNITVKVTKARLSIGRGDRLAYNFCDVSLRFSEVGLITSEPALPGSEDEGTH